MPLVYLYKRGQDLGDSGRLLGRFPGHCMHFCHFEGQRMNKFEMGLFPIRWGCHLELHFRSLTSRDLENQSFRLKMIQIEIFNVFGR